MKMTFGIGLLCVFSCAAQFISPLQMPNAGWMFRRPRPRRSGFENSENYTIYENLERFPLMSRGTLALVSKHPEIKEMLQDESATHTFFHPTMRAWKNFFRYHIRKGRPISNTFIKDTLKYHFVNESLFTTELEFGSNILTTRMSNPAHVVMDGDPQVVNVMKSPQPRTPIKVVHGTPGWKYSESHIIMADIKCKNGVIHVVDMVFSFPKYPSLILQQGEANSMMAAISASSLNAVLDSAANITIFVPLNEAIDNILSKGDVQPSTIKGVLSTHVAHGTIYSNNCKTGMITMFDGKKVDVVVKDRTITVGGAKVVLADVLVRNGVIHVVDKLLTANNVTEDKR